MHCIRVRGTWLLPPPLSLGQAVVDTDTRNYPHDMCKNYSGRDEAQDEALRFTLCNIGVRLTAEKGHCHPYYVLDFTFCVAFTLTLSVALTVLPPCSCPRLDASSVRPDNATVISHSMPSLFNPARIRPTPWALKRLEFVHGVPVRCLALN